METATEYNEKEIKLVCDYRHIDRETALAEGEANKAIASVVFEALSQHGVKVHNVNSLSGYFLFVFGLNSVYHFNVKGLSCNWKFGMWIPDVSNQIKYTGEQIDKRDKNPFIQVFCQHKDTIDKFKPSASEMVATMSYNNYIQVLNGDMNILDSFVIDVLNIIKFIRLHPLLAYVGYCDNYPLTYRPITSVIRRKKFNLRENTERHLSHILTYYVVHKIQRLVKEYPNIVDKVKFEFDTFWTPSKRIDVVVNEACDISVVKDMVSKVFPYYPEHLDYFGNDEFSIVFKQGNKEYIF